MDGEDYNGLSSDELWDVEQGLARINEQLASIARRQEEVVAGIGSGIRRASRDIEEFNNKIERDTSRALAEMVTGTKTAADAMRRVWQDFLGFFLNRIIKQISGALGGLISGGGGGGFFGALFGGLLGLFGLQEGGLVRGTRAGRLYLLGEKFTDELVVPLRKVDVGNIYGSSTATEGGKLEINPRVSIFPRFVIENNAPLDAEIRVFEMAESGRRLVAATSLIEESKNG